MTQPNQYIKRHIQSLDEIVKWMKGSPDKLTAKIYATLAKDRLKDLFDAGIDIDYESYKSKINPYLK